MTPYLSRTSGTSVIANRATAASESCSGIRHRLMSRCERSLVGLGASMGYEFKLYLPNNSLSSTGPRANAVRELRATVTIKQVVSNTPHTKQSFGKLPHAQVVVPLPQLKSSNPTPLHPLP